MKQITNHCKECGDKVEEYCPQHPKSIVESIVSEVVDKHYVYGSGMFGCLYDYGPHFSKEIEDAIDDLTFIFEDTIESDELMQMRINLKNNGRHTFLNAIEAGAQYCDVNESDGPMPESNED